MPQTTNSRNSLPVDENNNNGRITRSKTQQSVVIQDRTRAVLGDRSNTVTSSVITASSSKQQQHLQQAQSQYSKLNKKDNRRPSNISNNTKPIRKSLQHSEIPIKRDNQIIERDEIDRLEDKENNNENNNNNNNNDNDNNININNGGVQLIQLTPAKEEPRRASLKRSATESSTNLIEAGNYQENKKPKIDYVWEDLDEEDIDDPLMVSEYVIEIFQYLNRLEKITLPDPNYLTWQKNLKPKMRSILVDWMVEVHMRFRLLPETLFLAINIMDRFMSKEIVQVDKLQLLATGSLFIAAKYEEVYSPSIRNYAYVTDGGFTEDDILNAEKFILEILDFNMSYPNPMNFLRRISKADDYDIQSRTIGKYLLEISIIDYKFIGILPSLCSASAMYISRKMLGRFDWNGNLIHYSGGYREEDMKQCCEMIIDYLVSPIIHEEFFKKYASKKFFKVSILARQWAKKIKAEGKNIMDPVL
ncbi:hypothetical protein PACTADRAFT_51180 [Pachysolen tannophilus NRRL Y-2460]|uniref:Uncharacterized protein n=1 Tax=Pachysolen tannophilus NRRL Y-2460 TaxID=669874 RepID=A0A1E4TRG0_PACTA|nr:hypothetical protein PACTADRAFT_51180 [Pachysolen tannophilus NRRL Y-2460]